MSFMLRHLDDNELRSALPAGDYDLVVHFEEDSLDPSRISRQRRILKSAGWTEVADAPQISVALSFPQRAYLPPGS